MVSKNISSRHVFRIAPGIMAILLLLQAVAGAQSNNGSSETGVTYTQDVPFSTESIAQVKANESKLPAPEQRVIPFHKTPQPKVLKQGRASLKRLSAVQNQLFSSLAPVIGSSFIGITQAGIYFPPDTMGAAGPSHLMEITNDNSTVLVFLTNLQVPSFQAFHCKASGHRWAQVQANLITSHLTPRFFMTSIAGVSLR